MNAEAGLTRRPVTLETPMSEERANAISKARKEHEAERQTRDKVVGWIMSIVYILAAGGLIVYLELHIKVVEDVRIYRTFLNLSIGCYGLLLIIGVYSSYIAKNLPKDNSDTFPINVQIGAALMVLGFIFIMIALWPVYHLLTLPILIVLSLGGISLVNIIM